MSDGSGDKGAALVGLVLIALVFLILTLCANGGYLSE